MLNKTTTRAYEMQLMYRVIDNWNKCIIIWIICICIIVYDQIKRRSLKRITVYIYNLKYYVIMNYLRENTLYKLMFCLNVSQNRINWNVNNKIRKLWLLYAYTRSTIVYLWIIIVKIIVVIIGYNVVMF